MSAGEREREREREFLIGEENDSGAPVTWTGKAVPTVAGTGTAVDRIFPRIRRGSLRGDARLGIDTSEAFVA